MFDIDFDDVGTRLRDLFTLNQPLSADSPADPDDVKTVKRALKDEGHYTVPDYGLTSYPDKPLFEGIKGFQKAHDLKIDGIMNPGGETQTKMNDLARARRARQEVRKQVSSPVSSSTAALSSSPVASLSSPAQAGDPDTSPLDSPVKPGNDAGMDEPPEHTLIRDYILARNEQANPAPEPRQESEKVTEKETRNTSNITTGIAESLSDGALSFFKHTNLNRAEDYLKHYKEGSGKDKKTPSEKLEEIKDLKEAIQTNRERFQKGLINESVEGRKLPFLKQILELKDGETVTLKKNKNEDHSDYWDRDINTYNIESITNNPDDYLSFGHIKLKSIGDLKAIRTGDTVRIRGKIRHSFTDIYDFDDDTYFDKAAFWPLRVLAEQGGAKPYNILGDKEEILSAEITISNGKVKDSNFTWKDEE